MKDKGRFCNLNHKEALKKIHVLFNPVITLRKSEIRTKPTYITQLKKKIDKSGNLLNVQNEKK